MCKKAAIVVAGAMLVMALLFGRKMVPYATTAYDKVRAQVETTMPVEFQLDAARKQLKHVEKDVKGMLWEIAREEVAVKNLETELVGQKEQMESEYAHIMLLRDHLDSGDRQFVVHGREYNNGRVSEDLRNRFEVYKTTEQVVETTEQMLDRRQTGLQAAKDQLDSTIAQRRELEVQIANLDARQRMIDVAKTASRINIDDSQLARTREMIDDIKSKLDVEEQMLNIAPKYIGQIPLDGPVDLDTGNIVEEIDTYFDSADSDVVKN